MIDLIASEFNLNHHSFIYACITVGVLLTFNKAFFEKNWLKSFSITPIIEPIVNIFKDDENAKKGLEPFIFQLIGASALLILSFLVSYFLLSIFISFFKPKTTSGFIDIFADFWRGGHPAIDDRSKAIEKAKQIADKEIVQTHHAYSRLLAFTKFYLEHHPSMDTSKFRDLTILMLDSSFSTVFGKDQKFRLALYLHEVDPAKSDKLTLTCSVHVAGTTPDHINHEWPITASVAGKCYETGQIFTHPSKQTKSIFRPSKNPKNSFAKSFACIRVQWEKQKWGVLSLDYEGNEFPSLTEGQWLFLRTLASIVGECLEKTNGCSKWKSVEVK